MQRKRPEQLKQELLHKKICSKDGYMAECIDYCSMKKITILFIDDGTTRNIQAYSFLNGTFKKYKTKYKIGDKIGQLTIIGREPNKEFSNGQHHVVWLCQCDCDDKTIVKKTTEELSHNLNANCGCSIIYKNIEGQKFDRLTVVKFLRYSNVHNHYGNTSIWLCKCDCGRYVERTRDYLKLKGKKSCGQCTFHQNKPYSERIISAILNQLGVEYIQQYKRAQAKWCGKYRYDFYLPKLKIIIEAHGSIHYGDVRFTEDQESVPNNDELKRQLALNNGIDKEKYIVLDIKRNDINHVINAIKTNELFNLYFDINQIDFIECDKKARIDIEMAVIERWNNTNESTREIGEHFKLNKDTVRKYLVKGTKEKYCYYTGELGRERTKR